MYTKIRSKRIAALLVVAAATLYSPTQSAAQRPALDYEYFKTRIQPIFLKRRSEDHARCYACHLRTSHSPLHPGGLNLEKLSPGSNFWTEEQSRLNFASVSRLVVPGNLAASMFPMHPLAPEAGGDTRRFHTGGRQFESQNDPDFQTIAEWIRGQKAGSSSAP